VQDLPYICAFKRSPYLIPTRFDTAKERIMYKDYEEGGHPIGSGRVEGANKSLVDFRFCQAGMGWSKRDVNKILALRTLIFNRCYEQILCRRFKRSRTFARI
jgi:hypothetical protein